MRLGSLSGKATRREFLLVTLATVVASVAATVVERLYLQTLGPLRWAFVVYAIASVAFLAAVVRRLHDRGHSGVWALLTLVPVLAWVATLYLFIARSRPAASGHVGPAGKHRIGYAGLCLVILLGVARMFFNPFSIPAASNAPTLLVGDYIVVFRPFGRISARRGDVVVFRRPSSNEDWIKRVIGLPGDTVQMKNGQLYLNGALVPIVAAGTFTETYAPQGPYGDFPICENGPVGIGAACDKARLTETLPGGRVHDILNITDTGQADNTPLYTVPKDDLFVMGDNRDNSEDSRFPQPQGVGMLPEANLIGRADMIIFSSAGRSLFFFWTWRADRFFKWIV